MSKVVGNISLYGCGGAGINIAHMFERFNGSKVADGFAIIKPYYIDTSKANLQSLDGGFSEENSYLFDKIDGSGKIRRENAEQITKGILDILVKNQPGDLNIVVSSASGGSGSVIAPSLVSELIKQNLNVIVLCIGSSDSIIEITNTVNTLKSYESIAKLRKKPVVMLYSQNTKGVKPEEINQRFFNHIVQLSALFSRQNAGLDSADLRNWLDYTKYTSIDPKLMALDFITGYINNDEVMGDVVSIASLARRGYDTSPGITVDYRCYGIIPDEVKEIQIQESLHYSILDGIISKYFDELSSTKEQLIMRQNSRQASDPLFASSDVVENNGLIL